MTMEATVRIPVRPRELLEATLKALEPEASAPPTTRFKVKVWGEGESLIIHIKAKDTASLRAALNSYLRWVRAIEDAYKAAEGAG